MVSPTNAITGVKSASVGNALGKLHNFVRGGIWRHVAHKTRPDSILGRTSRVFHDPVKDSGTPLSMALSAYGLTGLGAGVMGYNLPGSELAMNIGTPGLGLLHAAPNLITAARANTAGNKLRLQDDVLSGARQAGSDAIALGEADPRFLTNAKLMADYIKQRDPHTSAMIDRYSKGGYKPLSNWQKATSLISDSQALIDDKIDKRIYTSMYKSAKWFQTAKNVASNVLPWLSVTAGIGGIGYAALRDKPYDEQSAQTKGYAGAQAKIQQELGKLSEFERLSLRLDPTLFADKIEKTMPGTIKEWEGRRGAKLQPGLLSSIKKSWETGDTPKFYQYDINNNRHYL